MRQQHFAYSLTTLQKAISAVEVDMHTGYDEKEDKQADGDELDSVKLEIQGRQEVSRNSVSTRLFSVVE